MVENCYSSYYREKKNNNCVIVVINFNVIWQVEIGVKQLFFGSFRGRKHVNTCDEKLKLKGWLSSDLFLEQFPDHYTQIIRGLPLPEYMDPKSGILNIASKMSQHAPGLDLGPCVYMSYSSGEELLPADSMTNLCYDLRDVVRLPYLLICLVVLCVS